MNAPSPNDANRLEAALIEATAELIYLRLYGKEWAAFWARENKDVWRGKAIAELSLPRHV